MKTYKTEGIILKRTNYGEADKILTLYTKHLGKIRVLARGVRKTTSRKGGNLELFNWVRVFVAQGRNLDLVTEVETVKSFKDWRQDLSRVAFAYHYCELVDKLTPEESPNHEIFELLCGSLENLNVNAPRAASFERRMLEETGFWPRNKEAKNVDFSSYIEQIIEGRLRSKKIFKGYLC